MTENEKANMNLESGSVPLPLPVVGMSCTEQVGSDQYAGKITKVSKSGRKFWYRREESVAFPEEIAVTLRLNGVWRVVGARTTGRVKVNVRDPYIDPDF